MKHWTSGRGVRQRFGRGPQSRRRRLVIAGSSGQRRLLLWVRVIGATPGVIRDTFQRWITTSVDAEGERGWCE